MRRARRLQQDGRRQVEAACDEFEALWRAGAAPPWESFVAAVPAAWRDHLIDELIELDLYYRRRRGESVERSDYERRRGAASSGGGAHLESGEPSADRADSPDSAASTSGGTVGRTSPGGRAGWEQGPVDPPPSESAVAATTGGDPADPESTRRPASSGSTRSAAGRDDSPGTAASGYEILEEIGRGGMGVVYRARQTRLKRSVALKMIRAGELASFEERLRFRREAETAARLRHPHIVQVFDVGEREGRAFLAMEYVEGGTLARLLGGRPQPPLAAARLLARLARAVQHAHEQGVVHRDLKPANVLMRRESAGGEGAVEPAGGGGSAGREGGPSEREASSIDGWSPKIADFGLAKLNDLGSEMTRTGAVLGTPDYMAPEAAAGADVGPAADVFSLGAILYEALTGGPPFEAATTVETLERLRSDDPEAPRRRQSRIPRDLETICLKCLEKEPRRRFCSAAALADDLERFLAGEPIESRPAGFVERGWRRARRRPVAALSTVGLTVAVVVVTFLVGLHNARLRSALQETERQRELVKARSDEALRERDLANRRGDQLSRQQAEVVRERDEARRQRAEAERQRERAAAERDEAERAVYSAELLLAARFLQDERVAQADGLLRRHLPEPGRPDRRGFEWRHLWSTCHQEAASWSVDVEGMSSVEAAPDGRSLIVCSGRATVELWDWAERRRRLAIPVEADWSEARATPNSLASAAFSPDGATLATCYGVVRLWDVATGESSGLLEGPWGRAATCVDWSADGSLLAVGDESGCATCWDVRRGGAVSRWKSGRVRVARVEFRPDGERLAVLSDPIVTSGSGLSLWDVRTGRRTGGLEHGRSFAIRDVAFTPDGRRCVVAESRGAVRSVRGRISSRSAEDLAEVWSREIPADAVCRAIVGADGATIWGGCDSGIVRRWRAADGEERPPLFGHVKAVATLATSRDGKRLMSSADDGLIKLWNADDGESTNGAEFRAEKPAEELRRWTVSADGRRAACEAGELYLIDLVERRRTEWGGVVAARATPLGFVRSGERLVVAVDGRLSLRDRETGWSLVEYEGGDTVSTVEGAPIMVGDRWVIGVDKRHRDLMVWETETGRLVRRYSGREGRILSAVALSDDGRTIAVGGTQPTSFVEVWKFDDDGRFETLEPQPIVAVSLGGNYFRPLVLRFHADEASLLVGANSGHVYRVDLAERSIKTIAEHDRGVRWMEYDRASDALISGSGDGVIKFTALQHGRLRFVLDGGASEFRGFAWAERAQAIVTAAGDGAIRVFRGAETVEAAWPADWLAAP